jgi:hypothetical protein
MDALVAALIEIISGLGPVSALGWLLALGQGWFIFARLRSDTSLQDKITEVHRAHAEAVKALQEHRIEDLKELLDRYDTTVNKLAEAIQRKGQK